VRIHLHSFTFCVGLILPSMEGLKFKDPFSGGKTSVGGGRDIVVNINEDDKLVESADTLLSEKSSSARGHLTQKRGDTFLNNYLDFKLPKQAQKGGGTTGAANSSGGSTLPVMNNSIAQNSSAQDDDNPDAITIMLLNNLCPAVDRKSLKASG